ncbi:MAG: hypothetical protein Q9160_000013 [Pyrenula sp. 1 TL-2023]
MTKWPRNLYFHGRISRSYAAPPFLGQTRHYESNAFVAPSTSQTLDPESRQTTQTSPHAWNASPLSERPIAIKDNICTKDFPTTCASNILGDFKSPYNATVVELLQKAGAFVVGKTNMDEFGMGSHNIHSRFGAVQNYFGSENNGEALSAGGSSGGSAMAVKEGQAWAALGTDTGGSVRLPAAYTGVVGFKPSYGLLSRYGVVAYANSLDTVGILAQTPDAVRLVFGKALKLLNHDRSSLSIDILNRYDANDPTSLSESTRSRITELVDRPLFDVTRAGDKISNAQKQQYKIGVPHEYNIEELTPSVRDAWTSTLASLRSNGHSIHSISLPTTRQALSAYYVLAPAEACSNLAKYDGVRYGRRTATLDDEVGYLFAKSRGEGFGKEVQRRILLGTYSLSAAAMDNHFIQAQRIRRLVQQDFDAVFRLPNPLHPITQREAESNRGVDLIVVPTTPSPPPKILSLAHSSPLDMYTNDVFTVPASLAGLPAVSIPKFSKNTDSNHLIGIQMIGQFGDDSLVLTVAKEMHDFFHAQDP